MYQPNSCIICRLILCYLNCLKIELTNKTSLSEEHPQLMGVQILEVFSHLQRLLPSFHINLKKFDWWLKIHALLPIAIVNKQKEVSQLSVCVRRPICRWFSLKVRSNLGARCLSCQKEPKTLTPLFYAKTPSKKRIFFYQWRSLVITFSKSHWANFKKKNIF